LIPIPLSRLLRSMVIATPEVDPGREEVFLDEVFELRCVVQHYYWGDSRFIPALIVAENPSEKPFAELWMGAHPDGSLKGGFKERASFHLSRLIQGHPERLLASSGGCPVDRSCQFLFKVLAANSPLSVQVHPTQLVAQEGFAKENEAGIKRDAAERNLPGCESQARIDCGLDRFLCLAQGYPCRWMKSSAC